MRQNAQNAADRVRGPGSVGRVPGPDYVTTGEAARALGVSVRSLQQWARDGVVAADHYTPGGHARWDVEELRSQLQMGRPRPRRNPPEL